MSSVNESCDLMISQDGSVRMIYSELLEAYALGDVSIQRVSHVEPDEQGYWFADMHPIDGPKLGPYLARSAAIAAEVEWLRLYWLTTSNESKWLNCNQLS